MINLKFIILRNTEELLQQMNFRLAINVYNIYQKESLHGNESDMVVFTEY